MINEGLLLIEENGELNVGDANIPTANTLLINKSEFVNEGMVNNADGIHNSYMLINRGTFINTSNSSITGNGGYTQQAGKTVLNHGTFSQRYLLISGGSFTGSGTIEGLTKFGRGQAFLAPGKSIVSMMFADDLELSKSTTTTQFEVCGLLQGSEYDVINVGGQVTLAGEIDVSLWDWTDDGVDNPFMPQAGDIFDLLLAETLIGEFDTLTFAALDIGLEWKLDYLIDEIGTKDVVRLSVISDTVTPSVPEPATMLLFGLGLLVITGAGRRK